MKKYSNIENRNVVLEKDEVRIIIRKLPMKGINVQDILNGIAITEMGFDLGIKQRIYFFDPTIDKLFKFIMKDTMCGVAKQTKFETFT